MENRHRENGPTFPSVGKRQSLGESLGRRLQEVRRPVGGVLATLRSGIAIAISGQQVLAMASGRDTPEGKLIAIWLNRGSFDPRAIIGSTGIFFALFISQQIARRT